MGILSLLSSMLSRRDNCSIGLFSDDICSEYHKIVTAAKYADSNANTRQIEKLLGIPEDHSGFDGTHGDKPVEADESKTELELFLERNKHLRDLLENESSDVVPGRPLKVGNKFANRKVRSFGAYSVPRVAYEAIELGSTDPIGIDLFLDVTNYRRRFHGLLWLEEAQQEISMRKYDMTEVMLARYENYFLVSVPGLAEGRPSLLAGDRIMLENRRRDCCYEGHIHVVREKDILIKLADHLHSLSFEGIKFDAFFVASRTTFRRQHFGIDQFSPRERENFREILFPLPRRQQTNRMPKVTLPHDFKTEDLKCFTPKLNIYQKQAIVNIMRAENRPAPYIVFGPCGTGKTVTLVEAIHQIYSRDRSSKILVVANSNACVDFLAEKIRKARVVPDSELVRLMAFYRMEALLPKPIEDICFSSDDFTEDMHLRARIVLTTCIQAGSLYEFNGRFDYVFVDEAGHASEPEVAIAMGLMYNDGCCVLAGDPNQLGPVCTSQMADKFGLGQSMLERLVNRGPYSPKTSASSDDNTVSSYDPVFITKLLICYRSDRRTLALNNRLFYGDELQCDLLVPQKWFDLLGVEKPLIFQEVHGRDRREPTNPSWYNSQEAFTCLFYAKRLYDGGLRADQLGIITPYRLQIQKIKTMFERIGLPICKVATMEEFQGDEREVIIISTVRTRSQHLESDKRYNLGFLFEPKRFNVGISRAKWIVIVIGKRALLERDYYWAEYIKESVGIPPIF